MRFTDGSLSDAKSSFKCKALLLDLRLDTDYSPSSSSCNLISCSGNNPGPSRQTDCLGAFGCSKAEYLEEDEPSSDLLGRNFSLTSEDSSE